MSWAEYNFEYIHNSDTVIFSTTQRKNYHETVLIICNQRKMAKVQRHITLLK